MHHRGAPLLAFNQSSASFFGAADAPSPEKRHLITDLDVDHHGNDRTVNAFDAMSPTLMNFLVSNGFKCL